MAPSTPLQFDTLLFERRDQVAHVTLNRPDKLNALDRRLIEDLHAAAAAIGAAPDIRAVLLTGAGRGFSSGADLSSDEFFQDATRSIGDRIEERVGERIGGRIGERIGASLRQQFNPMVDAWHGLKVPLVVAVNGVAAGAGMSLALLGDIVLAAHSATFVLPFAPKLGLLPDLGSTFLLPRLIGTARAKGLALLGDPLSAADAARWGLIWACVEDEALMDQAQAIARRLAAGPTQAFRHIKANFDRQPLPTLSEHLSLEARAQAELGDTQDFAEGVQAFRAKRAPKFSGT